MKRLMKMWAKKCERKEGQASSDESGCEGPGKASGPCMEGPPPHVMAHLFKECFEEAEDKPRKDEVKRAEKPTGADDVGCQGKPGMCWKQWMQSGMKPEIWFRVLHLTNVNREEAQVSVVDQKLTVQGVSNDDSSSSEGEQSEHSIDLPKSLMGRTLRTSWLGPHRLLAFGLKKPKQKDESAAETEEEAQKEVGCWFHPLPLPGYHQAQISVKVEEGKVTVHATKESYNEETGDSDHMEAKRIVVLPDDIRLRSLRWARMGPMRLCLFALRKKKQEKDEEEPERKSEEEKISEEKVVKEDDTGVEEEEASAEECEWVKLKPSEFMVEVDVHGFQPDELSVRRKKKVVVVSAKHQDEEGERSLRKTVALPADVLVESVRCSLNEDLLKVTAQRSLSPIDAGDTEDSVDVNIK